VTCTLAGRLGASHSTWVGLCDCPGTELAEDRTDEARREAPDFPDRERLLRELYVAELRARGVSVPSALVLDATADAIARNREKFSVAYSARVVAELGRDLWKLRSRPSTQ
jgi:hypothetical protein